jgi:peptide/nickel transport system substrate-binding protein
MQMALDLETMNNSYFNGLGDTTPQGMNGIPGYYIPFEEWPEEIRKTYRYDPAGAEKLLDEAGYPRGADGIRFKTQYTQSERSDLGYAEIVIEYWREIGVDVDIIQVDAPTFNTVVIEHTYEGMIGSFQGGQFPPLTSTGWGSSNASWNFPGFQDPTMDAMVEAALAATDLEEQRRLIKEVDMYQIENRWHIWVLKSQIFR